MNPASIQGLNYTTMNLSSSLKREKVTAGLALPAKNLTCTLKLNRAMSLCIRYKASWRQDPPIPTAAIFDHPKFRWWRIDIDIWQVCISKIVDHIKIIKIALETDDSTTHRIKRPWNLRISLLVFSLTTSSSFNGGDATSFSLRISNPGIWEHAQDMFLRQWKCLDLQGLFCSILPFST